MKRIANVFAWGMAIVVALALVCHDAEGRGGGGRGGGGGGRGGGGGFGGGGGGRVGGGGGFSGGGARPGGGNFGGGNIGGGARPGGNIGGGNIGGGNFGGGSRPNIGSAPSFGGGAAARPGGPSPGSRPNIGTGNRPDIGSRPNIGTGNRPDIGSRPNIGTGNRPEIGTGNRPNIGDGNRPQVGNLPSNTRPGTGGINSRPGTGAGIANRPATLPGLGNQGGIGNRADNRLPNNIADRRSDLQNRLQDRDLGNRQDRQDNRQGNRSDRQDNRQGNRSDRQNNRQEDWQNWHNDYHDNWHNCNNGWWDHMWDEHPGWMAFGLTTWGLNRLAYGFGLWGYSNPYYGGDSGGYYDYSQPIYNDQPVYVDQSQLASGTAAAPASPPAQGMSTFDQARTDFYAGNYDSALNNINLTVKEMPKDAVVHEFRSLVLFALGRYKESAATIYPVLTAGPGWDWATLVGLYPSVDVYTEQLRKLEEYTKANPKAPDAFFLLAYHYMTCNHKDAAHKTFQKVVALQPDDKIAAEYAQMTAPAESKSGSTAPPPAADIPDDKLIAESDVVGKWKAKGNNNSFSLELTDKGNFTWSFTQGKNTQTVKGAYALDNNTLAMEPDTGGTMLADLSKKGAGFHFDMQGAQKGDPGLDFTK